jgi:HK97 family phage prohead protease
MEYKVQPDGIKAINDRQVTGICAVFGNVDDGGDRLWPGAFSKTIQENRPRFRHLWMHDAMTPPTATIDDIKEVGVDGLPDSVKNAAPDAVGGLEVTRTYLDTPRGNELLTCIRAGTINEMSFGYDVIPGKIGWSNVNGQKVRELREVRLFDTSDVNWGMNPATAGVKALLGSMKAWTDGGGTLGLYLEVLQRVSTGIATVILEEGQDPDTIKEVSRSMGLAQQSLWGMLDALRTPDMYYGYLSNLPATERKEARELLMAILDQPGDGKAGARHSGTDSKMINQLHTLVTNLGATNCKGEIEGEAATEDGKSRADDPSLTLDQAAIAEAKQIIEEHFAMQARLRALRS